MLLVNRLESKIITNSLGASKPKSLTRYQKLTIKMNNKTDDNPEDLKLSVMK
jgi:hypothetical protein